MVALVSSPQMVSHDTGVGHPERPDRLRAIHRAVRDAGWVKSPDPFPDFVFDSGVILQPGAPLLELTPEPADERWIRLVHTEAMINKAQLACSYGTILDESDTPVGPGSYEAALLSLGGALRACDAVMQQEAKRAFSVTRPPGHHAEPDRSMGFCVFSNIAIAARYLQNKYGLNKIAIVDFDVHHGNGTQAAFEKDPSVFFASIHQSPQTCYPGTGFAHERGVGNILNVPIDPATEDEAYLHILEEVVIPAVENHRPEFLLLSAGFDAHRDDPLAEVHLSEYGFEHITRQLIASADRVCGGRAVSLLEGGYNLHALARSVVRHLKALKEGADET